MTIQAKSSQRHILWSVINTVLTGIYFGMLQWHVFFLLQSYLASTAIVYLLTTMVWLLGSVMGLSIRGERFEGVWIILSAVSYVVLHYLVKSYPYDLSVFPWLLCCVCLMGAYAGRFFKYRRKTLPRVKQLMFVENTAYVLGMLITTIVLYWAGDTWVLIMPLVLAVLCFMTVPK